MLPNEELNRKAFFDENALMTGLVKREFRSQKSITNLASELHDIADGRSVWRTHVISALTYYSISFQ